MNLNQVAMQQQGGIWNWYVFHDPFTFGAFWTYFTCAMASCKRALCGGDTEDASSVTGFARAAMAHLDRRGVRADFLYGAGDVGLDEAREHFGHDLGALAGLAHVHVRVLPCLDHALFLAASRDAFMAHVIRHVEYQQEMATKFAGAPATIMPTSVGT